MAVEANEAPISLKTFLEGIPPYVRRELDQRFVADGYETGQPRLTVALPSVSLYGENEACKGEMTFDPVGDKTVTVTTGQNNVTSGGLSSHLVRYLCRHCRRTWKTFALELQGAAHKNGSALKIGEWPPFGP